MKTLESFPQLQTSVLLGIPVNDITLSEASDWIARQIQKRQPSYVITANLDFAEQASRDAALQKIFIEADLVLCDGAPLLWASRFTDAPLRERAAGSDLVPMIAERAEREGWRLFLLGGAPESLEKASKNLLKKHPGLLIAGTYSPPYLPLEKFDNKNIVDRIKAAAPDVLLVAFGCPKQEKWIYQNFREAGVPCSIGIGATVDFLAGNVYRAPQWVARMGGEWLFRLIQEPRRLAGRYLKDFVFLIAQSLRERILFYRSEKMAGIAATPGVFDSAQLELLTWEGPLLTGTIPELSVPSMERPFIIDLAKVTILESGGLGHLIHTMKKAWKKGVVGCYAAPSDRVIAVLKMTRLDRFIPTAATVTEARDFIAAKLAKELPHPILDEEQGTLHLIMPERIVRENSSGCLALLLGEWDAHPEMRKIRIDFRACSFIDSFGFGFLVRSRRIVAEREGAVLEVHGIEPKLREAIGDAHLEKLLGITG